MRYHYLIIILCIGSLWSCDSKEIHSTVVIGGGLMGSSAAWQLSKNGEQVLLLEQQDEDYNYGSSQGLSRIARSLGPEKDMWGWLHDATVKETLELVDYLNSKTNNHKVSIEDIYATSPVTYVRHIKQLERIRALMYDGQYVPYNFAGNPKDAFDKYGMTIPDTTIVIREYKPHSGTVNPQVLINFAHHAIEHSNNEIRYQTRVDNLTQSGDHYRIDYTALSTNKQGTLYAKKIISAAGPWTGKILKNIAPAIDSLLKPQRVFLTYIKVNEEIYNQLKEEEKQKFVEGYPLINSSLGTRMGSNFSMIDRYENDIPIIKIGGHFQRSPVTDLGDVWQQALTDSELQWSVDRVYQYLNFLNLPINKQDLEIVDTYSCVYTLTQNETPYMSNAVNAEGDIIKEVVLMAGLSGVGAKGSLTYGKIAADLIMNIEASNDMERLVHQKMGTARLQSDVAALRK